VRLSGWGRLPLPVVVRWSGAGSWQPGERRRGGVAVAAAILANTWTWRLPPAS
jgi:hypothetical protein